MIPDNSFISSNDVPGPTKEEIRCLVICKSKVSPNDTVVDIGCGTGGLTVEFARRAQIVYAIDKNIEALKITQKNLQKHNLTNKVELLHKNALKALREIEDIDILMIGGSGGDLSPIIEKGYKKLKKSGRIIITSILLETPTEAIKTLQNLDMSIEVVNVSISKGNITERGTMMYANNPITIITAQK